MTDRLGEPAAGKPTLLLVYVRVVALLLLAAGLIRACMILGITPDGSNFSSLSPPRQAGTATLLLVDLFAALGLWIGAAWGPVMWAVALAIETSMYTLFSDLFGSFPFRVFVHLLIFIVFLLLTLIEWRRELAN